MRSLLRFITIFAFLLVFCSSDILAQDDHNTGDGDHGSSLGGGDSSSEGNNDIETHAIDDSAPPRGEEVAPSSNGVPGPAEGFGSNNGGMDSTTPVAANEDNFNDNGEIAGGGEGTESNPILGTNNNNNNDGSATFASEPNRTDHNYSDFRLTGKNCSGRSTLGCLYYHKQESYNECNSYSNMNSAVTLAICDSRHGVQRTTTTTIPPKKGCRAQIVESACFLAEAGIRRKFKFNLDCKSRKHGQKCRKFSIRFKNRFEIISSKKLRFQCVDGEYRRDLPLTEDICTVKSSVDSCHSNIDRKGNESCFVNFIEGYYYNNKTKNPRSCTEEPGCYPFNTETTNSTSQVPARSTTTTTRPKKSKIETLSAGGGKKPSTSKCQRRFLRTNNSSQDAFLIRKDCSYQHVSEFCMLNISAQVPYLRYQTMIDNHPIFSAGSEIPWYDCSEIVKMFPKKN